jgi:hypothetical protein
MPAEHCTHLRAALIATDARIFDRAGKEHRGDVRWCTQCGAALPLVAGVATHWMRPGDAEVAQAWDALQERLADEAAKPRKVRHA